MAELDVRIVKLEPLRVVCAYGFGPNPEGIASGKTGAYLEAHGWMDGYAPTRRTYGFSNANPRPGNPDYGYEIWVPVPDDARPEGDVLYDLAPERDIEALICTPEELARLASRPFIATALREGKVIYDSS